MAEVELVGYKVEKNAVSMGTVEVLAAMVEMGWKSRMNELNGSNSKHPSRPSKCETRL